LFLLLFDIRVDLLQGGNGLILAVLVRPKFTKFKRYFRRTDFLSVVSPFIVPGRVPPLFAKGFSPEKEKGERPFAGRIAKTR